MSRSRHLILLAALLTWCFTASASEPRIIKVLPHLLDAQGRHSLSPSLYERDAYQAILRKNPALVSGVRYDVRWKGSLPDKRPLHLRLYLRTFRRDAPGPIILEQELKPGWFPGSHWAGISLTGTEFQATGEVQAWRAVLLDGETEVAHQESFLW